MPTIDEYLSLPWTVRLTQHADEDGEWVEATVDELEGLCASARTPDEIESFFYEALRCHLEGMVQDGAPIPLPESPSVTVTPPQDTVTSGDMPTLHVMGAPDG